MTVHHLPKPIPDGDPNHQSRNFLVPGKSTTPQHALHPSLCGRPVEPTGQTGAGPGILGGGLQPPLPKAESVLCSTNLVLAQDPGSSMGTESFIWHVLPRRCWEDRPVPRELWPHCPPRPSPGSSLFPCPACVYLAPAPLPLLPPSGMLARLIFQNSI